MTSILGVKPAASTNKKKKPQIRGFYKKLAREDDSFPSLIVTTKYEIDVKFHGRRSARGFALRWTSTGKFKIYSIVLLFCA